MAGITRVFATHQLQYLPLVDRIYIMHDGTVQTSGTYAELVARGVDFVGLLNEDQEKVNGDDDVDQAKEVNGPAGQLTDGDEVEAEAEAAEESEAAEKERKAKGKLIDDEERRTGAVEWRVYGQYLMGTGGIAFLMLMLAISLVFEVRAPIFCACVRALTARVHRVRRRFRGCGWRSGRAMPRPTRPSTFPSTSGYPPGPPRSVSKLLLLF
jgi:hypothetical protein